MFTPRHPSRILTSSLLLASVTLSACSDNDLLPAADHDHDHVETSGRLVIAQSGSPTAHVLDLDEQTLIAAFTLDFPASAVSPSPDRRYAVLTQRADNLTQFIDGGIWQEDHGDHLHDYIEDPLLLAMKLDGVRPTHYELHEEVAALFFDGNSATGDNSGVVLLSDNGITNGETDATLDLPVAMHGTAEPRDGYLLTTYRDPADTSTTLPSAVELYERNGNSYTFVQRFAESCAALHGSYSNESHSAFGCSDGVLLVEQDGDTFTASKVANPAGMAGGSRIGTIVGHHELPDFAAWASSALYVVDTSAGSMSEVDWNGASSVTRVAHAMDAHGENFLILDSDGALHFLDPADDWGTRGTLDNVVGSVSASPAPQPAIAISQADEIAYVADPDGQSVAIIDLDSRTLLRRINLGFVPAGFTWLGLAEHEHEHEHEH